MKEARQFVFRYNGDEKTDDLQEDFEGELPVPQKGKPFLRNGKRWEMMHVVKRMWVRQFRCIASL